MKKIKNFRNTLFCVTVIFAAQILAPATGFSDASRIVINEMVHSGSQQIEDRDGDNQDWIELYNKSSYTVNLSDFYLSDDEDNPEMWQLPDMTIPPGGFIVIFASGKNTSGSSGELHTNFRLSSGEPVILTHKYDGIVDQITSQQSAGILEDHSIGRLPDGTGSFIHLPLAGPGEANIDPSTLTSEVVINEIMASNGNTMEFPEGSGEYPDWIELYNPGNVQADLRGYTISDDSNTWTFTQSVIVPAKGYLIVYANGENIASPPQTDFKLKASGETVTLADSIGTVMDQVACPSLSEDQSYGRFPSGEENFEFMQDPTPGTANLSSITPHNDALQHIVINEVVSSNGASLIRRRQQ